MGHQQVMRMSGYDAGFLDVETASLPMNTLKLTIVSPSDRERPVSAATVRALVEQRLLQVPGYAQRPLRVPLRLHHPEWVGCAVDLDAHVHCVRIDDPGGRRELDRAVAAVCGTRLGRDRPLWELWIFDGLAEGRIAVLHKIHHALADGGAAANQLVALTNPGGPGEQGIAPMATARDSDRTTTDVLRSAVRDRLRQVRGFLPLLRRTVATRWALRALDEPLRSSTVSLTGGSPATLFRSRLTPDRSFGTGQLPLDQALRVKGAFGVSLNDVLLAIAGSALRTHLAMAGQDVTQSLTAGIPMSTEHDYPAGKSPRMFGNRWTMGVTTLATDVTDPGERLRRISTAMAAVKERHRITGNLVEAWADFGYGPLTSALARTVSRWGLLPRLSLPNMIVSNVRGPDTELDIGEGVVSEFYSVGPLSEGIGINLTIWSFAGSLNVAVLSCMSMLPEPSAFIEQMRIALDALDVGEQPEAIAAGAPGTDAVRPIGPPRREEREAR